MQLQVKLLEKNALLKGSQKIEGVGLGLRFPHFDDILNNKTGSPWFEVITEDFLEEGPHHKKLLQLREVAPIVFHSIGLNVGGVQEFDKDYLSAFKKLYNKFQPQYISDHLCWSAHNGTYHHDLLPVPYTHEGLSNAVSRVNYIQDYFSRPLVLENITSYLDYKNSDFTEIEFLKELSKKTGCKLLLDITNVIINHKNNNEPTKKYFDDFPVENVVYCHVSGVKATEGSTLIIDAHNSAYGFNEDVLIKKYFKNMPILIERDANIPTLAELEEERLRLKEGIGGL